MRKLLIVLLVAGMLGGAVYGAAAPITTITGGLGAGDSTVAACDTSFTVSYTVAWSGTQYEVTAVTIQEDLTSDDCDATAAVSFQLTDGGLPISGASGSGALGVSLALGTPASAADTDDIHIAVTGG